jgi:hypothetical protein
MGDGQVEMEGPLTELPDHEMVACSHWTTLSTETRMSLMGPPAKMLPWAATPEAARRVARSMARLLAEGGWVQGGRYKSVWCEERQRCRESSVEGRDGGGDKKI